MKTVNLSITEPAHSLSRTFIQRYPTQAARMLESLDSTKASQELEQYPYQLTLRVIQRMLPDTAANLLLALSQTHMLNVLQELDTNDAAAILARMPEGESKHVLTLLPLTTAQELQSFLDYPEDTAASLMHTKVVAFNFNLTIEDAISQLRKRQIERLEHMYLVNDDRQLVAQVDVNRLPLVDKKSSLSDIAHPIKVIAQAIEPKNELLDAFTTKQLNTIPVVDINQRLLGVLDKQQMVQSLQEDMVSNMQTMVGVSKDERALSSSFFAVKKRLPWLQINLLTAFLAAAVVGLFEATIAKYTALAILLPIAAGQSGNAGAQALAVTMRGLTLREISIKNWLRVLIKECGAGLMNGLGIAITCSIGVYLWSESIGLALVMALSMIISMTIAGMAGAVVPILLKRFGLDPAQSSSIVLTTVTDIAGFMSFLGIATILSSML